MKGIVNNNIEYEYKNIPLPSWDEDTIEVSGSLVFACFFFWKYLTYIQITNTNRSPNIPAIVIPTTAPLARPVYIEPN
jgi:hypothetical protein